MGNGSFKFLDSERKTWVEHTLYFDSSVRKENRKLLHCFENGSEIFLTYRKSQWGGIEFEHWFITNKTHYLEFGGPDIDIYSARVTINTLHRSDYPLNKSCQMSEAIRDRMRHVLGMCNYSLCLRNCEHVANYVFRGRWISHQMDPNSSLMNSFKSYMMGDTKRLVNTFPAMIRPHVFDDEERDVYSFVTGAPKATRMDYYLDYEEEDTYNILVVGPTGAGKSHLINVLFNQHICDSEVSHRSVTKEICFVRGTGEAYNTQTQSMQQRKIVVADTVGLCDTEWSDEEVLRLIKARVSDNIRFIDGIFVVFRADRLMPNVVENIKRVMDWLQYSKGDNYWKFFFVGTYADYLSAEKKKELHQEATEIFGLKRTDRRTIDNKEMEALIYTGFPPEDSLNDATKLKVKQCLDEIRMVFKYPGNTRRLQIPQRWSCSLL